MERIITFEPRPTLGPMIRMVRESRGLTLEALASRMEDRGYPIHLSALSRYELHRGRTLDLETIQQIAAALNAPCILRMACQQVRQALPKETPPSQVATVCQLRWPEVG